MKRLLCYVILVIILLPSCGKGSSGHTTTVIKPKTYHRFYDRSKDKRKPRVKRVKMKG